MNKKVKVLEVKSAPDLKQLETLSGVRDRAAAEAWGEKRGYMVVYFVAKKQRVYADLLQVRIDEQAKTLDGKSDQLVMFPQDTLRYAEDVSSTGYVSL